jgi:hypothetical protein
VLIGFVLGGGAMYLWTYLKEKAVTLKWFEWILIVLGFITVIFLGQTFIASVDEGEIQAAWMSVLFMGLPLIVFIVVPFRTIKSRIT